MKRAILISFVVVVAVLAAALTYGSFYMLDFALSPDGNRADTDSCFKELYANYPETVEWMDSLRAKDALRDTFLTMPSGERHHAYFIRRGSSRTAVIVHGWRDQAVKFFYLARMYERELGYNVVMPDLHASGKSDGEALGMGWNDRLDVRRWMEAFLSDTMVVHGVSMGAATTMMLSGTKLPFVKTPQHPSGEGTGFVKDLRFVEDCGYTSVWDEFAGELSAQFGLPAFPLMYTTSLLCRLRYGWSFGEASALQQVAACPYPMLFIHGDSDAFVPTQMVHRLFKAHKGRDRQLWITTNTDHAHSYRNHRNEYIRRVRTFLR